MDLQPQTVQQCTPTLQPVRDALRQQEFSEERVEEIVQEVTELLVQATVQLSLMKGQKMLLASDERQHIGQRIEHFLNFTFGSITAANVRRQQRQEGLGGLDPFSLVFCGLSYKCKDIENMKQDHFDFLIDYIPSFVQRNGLSIHLSRPDISGKVMGHAHRESVNPALSQAFFTSYLDATYKHRKPNAASNALSAVADNLNTSAGATPPSEPGPWFELDGRHSGGVISAAGNSDVSMQKGAQSVSIQPGLDASQPSAEYSTGQTSSNAGQEVGEVPANSIDTKYKFTGAAKDRVVKLGSYLVDAMHNSKQWELEESQTNIDRTNCVSMVFPEHPGPDVLITIRVGQKAGFDICEDLELIFERAREGATPGEDEELSS